MEIEKFHSKEEAVAYVSAVMQHGVALLSSNFNEAMDVCQVYEISAQDVLLFRKEKAKRA